MPRYIGWIRVQMKWSEQPGANQIIKWRLIRMPFFIGQGQSVAMPDIIYITKMPVAVEPERGRKLRQIIPKQRNPKDPDRQQDQRFSSERPNSSALLACPIPNQPGAGC